MNMFTSADIAARVKALTSGETVPEKEAAAKALADLALNDAHKVAIAEAGGIPALIMAVKWGYIRGENAAGAVKAAAEALHNLADDKAIAAKIAEEGGIQVLAKVLFYVGPV